MTTTHTVILDGFLGRPGRWERLRRAIDARGGTASIYSYDCTGRIDLPTLGRQLSRHVRRIGGQVNLVGYSMGGLVIRTACMLDTTLSPVRAVFINSPHRGTWLAHLWPLIGVRQMRPGDAHLAALNAAPWVVPTLTVFNHFDGIVIPAASTRWPMGGEQFACPVPAHVWPVWSRRVHQRVAEFVTSPLAMPQEA
ncbi:MAG: lipase class 2 [Phycisphaerales bacterium]|nr:lipase class 2 [Phycisphaerales bacterium]